MFFLLYFIGQVMLPILCCGYNLKLIFSIKDEDININFGLLKS